MKTLTQYTQAAQSKAFTDNGAFFAFGQSQFDEKKQPGVKYANVGAGLVCPVDNIAALSESIKNITAQGIKDDIADNGIDAIIARELNNYECFYTGDTSDAYSALKAYNVTREQVQTIYQQELQKSSTLENL